MHPTRYTYYIYIFLNLLFASCGVENTLRQANLCYALGEYSEAAILYKKAYAKTGSTEKVKRAERAFLVGECYRRINTNAKAMASFRNAIRYGYPDSIVYKHMADLQLQKGEYKAAIANYDIYLTYNPTDTTAINGRKACITAPQWKKSPTRFIVKKEPFFNSRRSEYSPAFGSEDGTQLFFTSTRDKALGEDKSLITGLKAPDIFMSVKDEKGVWQKPEPIESEVNSEFEDGACCFTPD